MEAGVRGTGCAGPLTRSNQQRQRMRPFERAGEQQTYKAVRQAGKPELEMPPEDDHPLFCLVQ